MSTENAYFGGVVEDESAPDFFSESFLWCPFLLFLVDFVSFEVSDVDDAAAGVEAGAGVDWASTGPAIRARAMTGTSFLNIDVVSRERFVC